MQKKIKYNETTLNEMKRIIKAFNQRRAYQIKKNPETADLQPPKMSLKEVKKQIATKSDLEQWKKDTQNYNAQTAKVKTNKQGVKATVYEIEKVKKQIARKNREAVKKQKENQRVFVKGKEIKTAKRVLTEKEKKPYKADFKKASSQKAWDKTVKSINTYLGQKEASHAQVYFDNLLSGLEKSISSYDEYKLLYEVLGVEIIDQLLDLGFDAVDLDYIYDPAIDESTKEEKIFEELTTQIKEHGKVKNFVEKLKEFYNVEQNQELKLLWSVLGNDKIFDLYINGYAVNYPVELYEQINKLNLKDKLQKKSKK